MDYYRAIKFKSSGPLHEREVSDEIEAIAGVRLLSCVQRKLGWLERTRLLFDEYLCQMVLVITAPDEAAREPAGAESLDLAAISPELAALLAEVGATHNPVDQASLFFESRVYDEETIAALERELSAVCERVQLPMRMASVESSRRMRSYKLVGRVQGPIDRVHELRRAMIETMRVGADAIKIRYV